MQPANCTMQRRVETKEPPRSPRLSFAIPSFSSLLESMLMLFLFGIPCADRPDATHMQAALKAEGSEGRRDAAVSINLDIGPHRPGHAQISSTQIQCWRRLAICLAKADGSVRPSQIPSLTLIQVETAANFGSAIIATPDSTPGGIDPEPLGVPAFRHQSCPFPAGPCQVARKISHFKLGSATVLITNLGMSETDKSLAIRLCKYG